MPEAMCPTCGGHGKVATRKLAYSGLPQIDQIVNADESPQATPLPEEVAWPLTGWGEPGQGQQNVQQAIGQTEQLIAERQKKSPLLTSGASLHQAAGDDSGWLGDMGAKGPDYPGYSEPTGYDGSSNLGQPDPVYGYGGDNGNKPLLPYGNEETSDYTNDPGMNWQPGQPTQADQGYRQTAPAMSTQGARDPIIASAEEEIEHQKRLIAARTGQLTRSR